MPNLAPAHRSPTPPLQAVIPTPGTACCGSSFCTRPEARKWERVSLAGTKAYAILTDVNQKTATVMDLSYGGVALLVEKPEDIPNQFNAVLHVPILPPVRVVLRKTYTQPAGGRARIGCAFVS